MFSFHAIKLNISVAETVNHFFFATTLFRDLAKINWFAETKFCDQYLSNNVLY